MNRRAIDALIWLRALKRTGAERVIGDIREYDLHYRLWNPVAWIIYAWLLAEGMWAGLKRSHEVFNAGFKVQAFVNRQSKRRHGSRKRKKGGKHENATFN